MNSSPHIDLPILRERAQDRSFRDEDNGFVERPLSGQAPVRRRAVVQNGCFGWLHTPVGGAAGDVAVLLCTGLFWDALQPHHTLRLLADDMAAAGFAVLRFDYIGTGSSLDVPSDVDPWAAWLGSVHAAADWLRETAGASRLILCGLRAGATLAVQAAETRADVAGLLLLAPVLRGSSYVKQLRIEAQLESRAATTGDGGFSFHDVTFRPDVAAGIGAIDLRRAALPAGLRIGLAPQAASTLAETCAAAWRRRGAVIDVLAYDGLEPLLRVDVQSEHPPPDFATLRAWLSGAFPAGGAVRAIGDPPPAVLHPPGCTETALRFGAEGRLFGVLCRPASPSGLAVVIVNTGRDPQYGVARFGVEFSRRLAAAGIAALRMDFAGLGDSTGAAGQENHHSALFDHDRRADLSAALDLLQLHGFSRFALHGLCSGGYHALQGGLADPRVAALLLINLPVFRWVLGEEAQFVTHRQTSPLQYLAHAFDRMAWRRLLGGEVRVGRLLRAQAMRLGERLGAMVGWRSSAEAAARQAVARLCRRGVRTLLLYCPNDPGLEPVERAFGAGGAGLREFEGVTMQVVEAFDHLLSTAPMRAQAAAIMIETLLNTGAVA